MNLRPPQIIICETVLQEMLHILPPGIEYHTIESGLHLRPEKLKIALQEMIDRISADTDRIILGFGLCSMAVIGLKAASSTLIVPLVDDCIALFLGSRKLYMEQTEKEPGTYYLSKGWIEAGVTLVDEFSQVEERLGERGLEVVKKRMLEHYTRLAYIDMGNKNQKKYREFSQQAAKDFNLRYEEVKGTAELLRKMIHGPWDEEFVVAPPGHRITLEDFGMIPSA